MISYRIVPLLFAITITSLSPFGFAAPIGACSGKTAAAPNFTTKEILELVKLPESELTAALSKLPFATLVNLVSKIGLDRADQSSREKWPREIHAPLAIALIGADAGWEERAQAVRNLDRDLLYPLAYAGDFVDYNLIDAILGYDIYAIAKGEGKYQGDQRRGDKQRTWAGGQPWTPHHEILRELEKIFPTTPDFHLIDAGAGVGRVGVAMMAFFPEAKFTGFEFVKGRVDAANAWAQRFGLTDRFTMIHQDLTARDFKFPEADILFMYQPFHSSAKRIVDRKVEDMVLASKQPIWVLVHADSLTPGRAEFRRVPWSEIPIRGYLFQFSGQKNSAK